jgi:hypothetical protein
VRRVNGEESWRHGLSIMSARVVSVTSDGPLTTVRSIPCRSPSIANTIVDAEAEGPETILQVLAPSYSTWPLILDASNKNTTGISESG